MEDISMYFPIIHAAICGRAEVLDYGAEFRIGDNPNYLELMFYIEWNEGFEKRGPFTVQVPTPRYIGDARYDLVFDGEDPNTTGIGVLFWEDQIRPLDDVEILWITEYKGCARCF